MDVLKEKCFFLSEYLGLGRSNCKSVECLLHLRDMYNAMHLLVFVSFFFQLYPGLRNCKSGFLILKISQYGGSRRRVQLFLKYLCKN